MTAETMSTAEVAELLQCTEETVLEKAACGLLAAVKYGRSWVFLRSALFEGLHRTALDNLKPTKSVPKPAPPAREPMGYLVAPAVRQSTRRTIRPTLPQHF